MEAPVGPSSNCGRGWPISVRRGPREGTRTTGSFTRSLSHAPSSLKTRMHASATGLMPLPPWVCTAWTAGAPHPAAAGAPKLPAGAPWPTVMDVGTPAQWDSGAGSLPPPGAPRVHNVPKPAASSPWAFFCSIWCAKMTSSGWYTTSLKSVTGRTLNPCAFSAGAECHGGTRPARRPPHGTRWPGPECSGCLRRCGTRRTRGRIGRAAAPRPAPQTPSRPRRATGARPPPPCRRPA